MLLNLAWEYINLLNSNEAPLIIESMENVISSEARKFKDEVTEEFDEKVFAVFSSKINFQKD
jgi:hypothetical protein